MNNYQIEHPIYFYFFGISILLILLLIRYSFQQKNFRALFKNKRLNPYLYPNYSPTKKWLKSILSILAISILILALVNPRMGLKNYKKTTQSLDLVFMLDISKSMLAEDLKPSRLEVAKDIIIQSFPNLENDQISTVAYAGTAQVLFPLTNDFNIAEMYIDNADPSLMSAQGTSLAYALEQGIKQFDPKSKSDKIMILLSDGEDHDGDIQQIKDKLLKDNIQLLTIGLGTTIGAPIPEISNGILVDYKKDSRGETVITQLQESLLSELSNGQLITPTHPSEAVESIKQFTDLKMRNIKEVQISGYQYLFPGLTMIALVFLLLNEFIFEARSKWLFNSKKK